MFCSGVIILAHSSSLPWLSTRVPHLCSSSSSSSSSSSISSSASSSSSISSSSSSSSSSPPPSSHIPSFLLSFIYSLIPSCAFRVYWLIHFLAYSFSHSAFPILVLLIIYPLTHPPTSNIFLLYFSFFLLPIIITIIIINIISTTITICVFFWLIVVFLPAEGAGDGGGRGCYQGGGCAHY